MLKMIHGKGENRLPAREEIIDFKDAAWPVPFVAGLEYNSPCHGTWNIVHIAMAVPGAHQIYVCGANCNRGVVLTAAEMQASDRYSTITLFENDLIDGNMESLIIDGVSDIIRQLPQKPPLIFLFTVCVHRFMGLDLSYVYEELRSLFPDIIFVESYMEPISQKDGLTPEQRLRDGMCSFLKRKGELGDQAGISIIGSDFKIEEDSEIMRILRSAPVTVRESSSCQDMDQYLSMGDSSLFLCLYPTGLHAIKQLAKRLNVPWLYLPFSLSYEENDRQLEALYQALSKLGYSYERVDNKTLKATCQRRLMEAKDLIGDTAIAIDAHALPRYLGLARLLISHGFRVIRLYGDVFSPEEKEDYDWLQENAPGLTLCSMIHPGMRVFPRGQEEKVLAIGQKAAYFHQTPYFVNMVQGAGLHGYAGILRLIDMMEEACLNSKDTKDLVGRKGLGCQLPTAYRGGGL